MTLKPTLLLLPNLLGEFRHAEVFLPSSVFKAMQTIDGLIAESEKEGRRYLARFETKKPAAEIPIALFNEHTPDSDLDFLLEPILAGERWGLVSDAGLLCIADPGCKLVRRANQRGISVQAFVGPSSILTALMLSGLPGKNFIFRAIWTKIRCIEKSNSNIFYSNRPRKRLRKSLSKRPIAINMRLTRFSKSYRMRPIFVWRGI